MAETLFLIHGMWGGPWYWANYQRVFDQQGHRCIAATLPFHDMAPDEHPDPRLGKCSLLDYAAAMEQQIRRIGVKPVIIGHSMGGLLAQILGSRGLAKALVLLTPSSPAGIFGLRFSVIKGFWSAQTKWGFWRKPMRQTFDEASYSMLHLCSVTDQKEIYQRFVYESGRAAFETGYWFFDLRGASRIDESKVKCPMLVIAAALDRITPAAVVRRVANKYQAVATYREFANHAHWVVAEPGWQEIAEYVTTWIEQVVPNIAEPSI
jgi:pimeloyl-ACP methyl ester carboxylesterase